MSSRLFRRVAVIFLALFACSANARDIIVGQVVDYAGDLGEAARDYVAGARIYLDSVNAAGGVNGNRIRLETLDIKGSTVRARTRELLDEKSPDVLFGFMGDEALAQAAMEPELQGRIALVAPLAGGDAPAGTAGNVFFTRPGYEAEMRQVESHFGALQVTRFALLHEADLRDLDAVKRRNAQALIVLAGSVPTAEFVKRYRARDPGAMIVALSTVNHRTLFELLGPKLAHGVMVTQVVPNPNLPESALQKEHLDAIRKFRDEPPSHLTLEGFIAAKVLVEGLKRAGPNPSRETILAAMKHVGRLDLHGYVVDVAAAGRARSGFVDIAMIRRDGALLQ
jgi:ABC-type branched-subunit amino acid transport system substrate-binding protein